MPTIQQLPRANTVTPADRIPFSQDGEARSTSIGTLLAETQPAILIPSGTILGRSSVGPGGPEPVEIGTGLVLHYNTLSATALTIATLPPTTLGASQDQLAIDQNGTAHAITIEHLLNGLTIDQAQVAATASDADTFWVAQGSNTMTRQTLSALWSWVVSKLVAYKTPTIELSQDVTLDGTTHNGRILVCKTPLRLSALPANMGNGFHCEVINLSAGTIVLDGGFISSSNAPSISAQQSAQLRCMVVNATLTLYAQISSRSTVSPLPGAVDLLAGTPGSTTALIAWSIPITGGAVLGYFVRYRPVGSTIWITAGSISTGLSYTITGLLPSSPYEVGVTAFNDAGSGQLTLITATTTAAPSNMPGQVTMVATGSIATTTIGLIWQTPSSGGPVVSYTVEYRPTGTTTWSGQMASTSSVTQVVTNLNASTSYDFRVTATNVAGTGPASSAVTATTLATPGSVASIVWNFAPSGSYTAGAGAIGVNAHVTPATAAIRFGFSTSGTTPPGSWTDAIAINTDLWGAYAATPASAGTWYAWAQGTDGSSSTVYATPFTVT